MKTKDIAHKKADETDRRVFAAAFILKCASAGITDIKAVTELARKATAELMAKKAFGINDIPGAESAGKLLGNAAGLATLAPIVGSVAAPMAAGFGLGAVGGHAKNQIDNDDAEALRIQAQANAYRRRAATAAAHAQVRKLVASDPSKYVAIG